MKKLSLKVVRNSDSLYRSGRRLVHGVYSDAWGTQPGNLCEDYDFAVLICDRDEVKGNLNIKCRTADMPLPSEKYFRPRHWEAQCPADAGNVAELCSLAVCHRLSNRERILVFNGLILGSHLLAMHQGIQAYVTVQRSALINTLIRLMRYPFFPSHDQEINAAHIPDDKYWTMEPRPKLYYVLSDTVTDSASFRLLSSFLANGLSIEGFTASLAPPAVRAMAQTAVAEPELAVD